MRRVDKQPLVVLAGPTAVGKTSLSVELAKRIGGEIISADSMQVYRGMDIGTAKIKKEEMQGVSHYLIDEFNPDEVFNVTIFQERAKRYIGEIAGRGHIPVIVGGTGFYIQAVARDIDFTEYDDGDGEIRRELLCEAQEKGAAYMFEQLKQVDPEYARIIHEHNIKKVVRALEFCRQTGNLFSEHNARQQEKESPYNLVYLVLTDERDALYARIEQRVDKMLDEGLVFEVKRLLKSGYGRELTSMQGIGYKEIAAFLDGECTQDEAIARIKHGTKQFAKRQITWFKRESSVIWIEKNRFADEAELREYVAELTLSRVRSL